MPSSWSWRCSFDVVVLLHLFFTAGKSQDDHYSGGYYESHPDAALVFSSGSDKYCGASEAPGYITVFAPHAEQEVGIFHEDRSSMTKHDTGLATDKKYCGAATAPDGRVFFAPYKRDRLGVWDWRTKEFSEVSIHQSATSLRNNCKEKPSSDIPFFKGIVALRSADGSASGSFLLVPFCAQSVVIVTPTLGQSITTLVVSTPNYYTLSSTAAWFSGAATTFDGTYVWFAPYESDKLCYYKTASKTMTCDIALTDAEGFDPNAQTPQYFGGVAITRTNKVVLAPYRFDKIAIRGNADVPPGSWLHNGKEGLEIPFDRLGHWSNDNEKYVDAVVTIHDSVVLAPYISSTVLVVDAETYTYQSILALSQTLGSSSRPTYFFGGAKWAAAATAYPHVIVLPPGGAEKTAVGVVTQPRASTYVDCYRVHNSVWDSGRQTNIAGRVATMFAGECAAEANKAGMLHFAMARPQPGNNQNWTRGEVGKAECWIGPTTITGDQVTQSNCWLTLSLKKDSRTATRCNPCKQFLVGGDKGTTHTYAAAYTVASYSPTITTSTTSTLNTTTGSAYVNVNTTTASYVPPKKVDDEALLVGLIVGLGAGVFLICAIVAFVSMYGFHLHAHAHKVDNTLLRQPLELPPELLDPENEESLFTARFSMHYLLNPPLEIKSSQSDAIINALKNLSKTLGDPRTLYQEVFIVSSLGRRNGDAVGAGPGLFFTAALCKLLYTHGVPCCTSFLTPETVMEQHHTGMAHQVSIVAHSLGSPVQLGHHVDPHTVFMNRATAKDCLCKVVLLVETEDLYQDKKCLEQLDACLTRPDQVLLIPLRFERTHLISKDDRWDFVKWAHSKKLDAMLERMNEALEVALPIPTDGLIPEQPKFLMAMLQRLAGNTSRIVNWSPARSPWESKEHDESWVTSWFHDVSFEPPPPLECDADEGGDSLSPLPPPKKGGWFSNVRKSLSRSILPTISEDNEGIGGTPTPRKKRQFGLSVESATSRASRKPSQQKNLGLKNMASGSESTIASNAPQSSPIFGTRFGNKTPPSLAANAALAKRPSQWGGLFGGATPKRKRPSQWGGIFGAGEEPANEQPKKAPEDLGSMFDSAKPPAAEPEPALKERLEEPAEQAYAMKEPSVTLSESTAVVGISNEEEDDLRWMDVDEKDEDVKNWRVQTNRLLDFEPKTINVKAKASKKNKLGSPSNAVGIKNTKDSDQHLKSPMDHQISTASNLPVEFTKSKKSPKAAAKPRTRKTAAVKKLATLPDTIGGINAVHSDDTTENNDNITKTPLLSLNDIPASPAAAAATKR